MPLLIVPLSMNRDYAIDVTPQMLRVRREHIPVAAIDPGSVHEALRLSAQGGRLAHNLITSANSGFTFRGRNAVHPELPRLVGGAYAVPMGRPSTMLVTREGGKLLIVTRSPEALLRALATATATPLG